MTNQQFATHTKLQRQEEEEEAQHKLQRQEEEEEAQPKLQRQADQPQASLQRQVSEALQAKAEARANRRDKQAFQTLDKVEEKLFANKGRGEPLDDAMRTSMEVGFGADFSGVRVHNDGDAVAMSRELKAQAFTHGNDVFFNAAKFEPDTVRGRTLLAHELTHVVQQGAAEQNVPEARIEANNAGKNEALPEPADNVENNTKEKLQEREPRLGGEKETARVAVEVAQDAATATSEPSGSMFNVNGRKTSARITGSELYHPDRAPLAALLDALGNLTYSGADDIDPLGR